MITFSFGATAPSTKPLVVMFGGYGSTTGQINSWVQGAKRDTTYGSKFEFAGEPLPSRGWRYPQVAAEGKKKIDEWIERLNADPARQITLVGHSSGSAVAIEIAKRVKNPSRIKLLSLDGFTPRNLPRDVQTTCWSARGAERGGLVGLNRKYLRNCRNYKEYRPYQCRSQMALHYILINSNACRAGVNSQNYKTRAYDNLQVNLSFLSERTQHAEVATDEPGSS